MKTMIILYGGISDEHEVSCISAAGVLAHVPRDLFTMTAIGIDARGTWMLQPASLLEGGIREGIALPILPGPSVLIVPGQGLAIQSATGLQKLACDVVFPVLHGHFGEDGTIQGALELAGLPYIGADLPGSAIGMDKEIAKVLWRGAGLPVADWITVHRADLGSEESLATLVRKVDLRLGWPAFVKPASGGSSVGTSRVEGPESLGPALHEALVWDNKVLIEPCIEAREIECPVLGSPGSAIRAPSAFAPGEIVPSHRYYDYDAKYKDPAGARLLIPAPLQPTQAATIQSLALQACKVCGIEGMARVDFFLDRMTGEILINEVNTIPGFTHISMYPRMCVAAGVDWPELIGSLADLAVERNLKRAAIRRTL